jgi:hypothetical protein
MGRGGVVGGRLESADADRNALEHVDEVGQTVGRALEAVQAGLETLDRIIALFPLLAAGQRPVRATACRRPKARPEGVEAQAGQGTLAGLGRGHGGRLTVKAGSTWADTIVASTSASISSRSARDRASARRSGRPARHRRRSGRGRHHRRSGVGSSGPGECSPGAAGASALIGIPRLLDVAAIGLPMGLPGVDPLEFQKSEPAERDLAADRPESMLVKPRCKAPDGDTSKLIRLGVVDEGVSYATASDDFKFACAVAGFGMLLRELPHKGSLTYDAVLEMASPATRRDPQGYGLEILALVHRAQKLSK